MIRSVKELRQQGYKIGIRHNRCSSTKEVNEKNPNGLCPNGGVTIVTVTTPDGRTVEGEARCNTVDNYNKRIGVQIALGRALKELNTPAGRQMLIPFHPFSTSLNPDVVLTSSVEHQIYDNVDVGSSESRGF